MAPTIQKRGLDLLRRLGVGHRADRAGAPRTRRADAAPERPEHALDRIDRTWSLLWSRLNAQDDAALQRPGAAGDWSAKDVLMHLARWHEAALTLVHLHTTRRGRIDACRRGHLSLAVRTDDEWWNAHWHAEDRDASPSLARARAALTYLDLRAFLAALPAEQWDAFVHARVRACTWEHYREHLEALDALDAAEREALRVP